MIVKRHISFLLLLLLAGAGYAVPQSAGPAIPLNPDKAISQYRIDHWTTEHGLPMNRVQVLLQTSDGYIWLGTQEGLARFDGFKFTIFDSRNSAMPGNDVSSMAEDHDGNLWIGTYGGLVRYRNGRFNTYTTEEGLRNNQVHALSVDRHGKLWISTQAGISIWDGNTFTHPSLGDGKTEPNIRAIYEDAEGSVWLGTLDAGIIRWGDGRVSTLTTKSGLPSNAVTAIHGNADGTLWIGTKGGLATLKDGTIRVTTTDDGLGSNWVRALREDASGALWIGTEGGGLTRFYKGSVDSYAENGASNVWAIIQDMEGSLWVGTQVGGLFRLQDGKFTTFTTDEGLGSNYVYSVVEDAAGDMWFGTTGGGVSRLSGGKIETFTVGSGLPVEDAVAVYAAREGSVWIGTQGGGLVRYQNRSFHTYNKAAGLPSETIYNVFEDSRGALWLGTYRDGLVRFDGRRFITYTTEDGLTHDAVTAVAEGPDGFLWIGTYRGGINLLKDGVVIHTYTTENGLPDNNVTSLYRDKEAVLWIATQEGGLTRLRDGQLSSINADKGLYNNTILQILEDDGGDLWMSSNKGLFRIPKKHVHAVMDGRMPAVEPVVYDRGDGLRTSEFNGGAQPAGWKDRQGRLWFVSNKGVVCVDPNLMATNTQPPPIVIERFVAGGATMRLDTNIVLAPGNNKIEIDFVGLSYVANDEVIYRYRLEGIDKDWIEVGSRRQAFYTNLPPGDYTFHVMARNADGVWSTQSGTVSFYLKPFFYQTLWFIFLVGLVLVLAGIAVYKLRVRQLKARQRELEQTVEERTQDLREEKEKVEQAKTVIEDQAEKLRELDRAKTRFFGNISHEFRTPLTLNIGPMENALAGIYGPVPDVLRKQMEIMLRNARRLLRLINQLLDLSKLESGRMELQKKRLDMVQFVEGVSLSFSAFTEKSGIDLTFEADEERLPAAVDPEAMEKVIFNLLSNAVKFTPEGGTIAVSIRRVESESLAFSVKDSGSGIPQKELPHIFDRFHQVEGATSRVQAGTGIGLALVKEVVELHEGAIAVESEMGVGTEFIITLPMEVGDGPLVDVDEELGYTISQAPMDEMAAFRDSMDTAEVSNGDDAAHIGGSAAGGDGASLVGGDGTFAFADVGASPSGAAVPGGGDGAAQDHFVKKIDEDVTILVTDDNPDIREYMVGCLSSTYKVVATKNGLEAFHKAREIQPDLIISDVMMPKMTGYELCRAIRDDDTLRLTPIILVTSKAAIDDKIEGLEAGADDYLPKPFNAEELFARVRNLLTLRKQQKALRELNDMLQVKNVELHDASELKSQLLRIAAHDLKNPLNNIREFANLIQEEIEPGSEIGEMLGLIKSSSNKMLELITQILESEALESGQLQIEKKPVDLANLASSVVEENRKQAERKGQKMTFDIPRADNYLVDGSEEWLVEAMENLISNAIKYSLPEMRIWVTVYRKGDRIVFEVKDEGPGLSSADQEKLFQKFQRLSSRPTGGESSTGLGLSIVKQIVEMHGGEIRVESEEGAGSSFIVELAATEEDVVVKE